MSPEGIARLRTGCFEQVTASSDHVLTIWLTEEQCLSVGGRCPMHDKEDTGGPPFCLDLQNWQVEEEYWHPTEADRSAAREWARAQMGMA